MWWLPLAGAATGILGDLFGGDDYKQYTREEIEKLFPAFDESKMTGDLSRLISARLKSKRQGIDAQNRQSGFRNPTDVYSNEEFLYDAERQGLTNIKEQKRQREERIASTLAAANLGQPLNPSTLDKIFEGGLTGAGLGFSLWDIINKGGGSNEEPVETTPEPPGYPAPDVDLKQDRLPYGALFNAYLRNRKNSMYNPLASRDAYTKYLNELI